MAISHTPWQPCFLMDQIPFSYFCKGSPNIHFYRIKCSILNTGFRSNMFNVSYIGTLGKLATPPDGYFIEGLICFGYFCGKLSNDHFYPNFFEFRPPVSEKIFKVFVISISHPLFSHFFKWIKFLEAIFVEGHLISAKLFSILTTSFREDF